MNRVNRPLRSIIKRHAHALGSRPSSGVSYDLSDG